MNTIKHKIITADGEYVDLINPQVSDISLSTIAASLSKLCRFGGHCSRFYSVAEHCVLATDIARNEHLPPEAVKAMLLHDAAEAYLGDMVNPLKQLLPSFGSIERSFNRVIQIKFDYDVSKYGDMINRIDRQMLAVERAHFWPDDQNEWGDLAGIVRPQNISLMLLDPDQANDLFLQIAGSLGIK